MPFQTAERVERVADTADEPRNGAPSEVTGGQIGEQCHRDVRGAGAGGDHHLTVHLHVVWRKPVGMGRHVFLEVAPGASSGGGQESLLRNGEPDGRRRQRLTDPPGDERREQPCRQPGRRGRDHVGPTGHDEKCAGEHGCQRAHDHRADEAGKIVRRHAIGISRGLPLQQVATRDEHPHERAGDGIDGEARLVGQHAELEHSLHQWPRGRPRGFQQVLGERHVVGLAQKVEQAGQQGGQQCGQDDQSRSGRGQPPRARQPAADEQADHRRGHQASPHVVDDFPCGEPGQRVLDRCHAMSRDPRQQPPEDLPVAANPAVSSPRVGEIARWMLLVEHHVALQP